MRTMKYQILTALVALFLAVPASAQDGPPAAVRKAITGLTTMLESRGDEALDRFATDFLADRYRDSFAEGALLAHLRALRDAGRGHTDDVGVEREAEGVLVVILDGDRGPRIRVGLDGSSRIVLLERVGTEEGGGEPESATGPSPAGNGPATREEAERRHIRALEGLGRLSDQDGTALLQRDHLDPAYLGRVSDSDLQAMVHTIRLAAGAAGNILLTEDDAGTHLRLVGPNGVDVVFRTAAQSPFRITDLRVEPLPAASGAYDSEPITWQGLEARMAAFEASGFSGVVFARGGGREPLHRAYGMADRSAQRPNATRTIFGIGSTPIDFTITATLLLAQRGALRLDDTIGLHLPGVPADKAAMTLNMILDGRSGLPNFHDTEADWDRDLAWIDRDTALRRILAAPLLFPPGTGEAHSHSAYGLLAAIVELVSGRSYPEFVRQEILAPLGMTRTGFYGESLGLSVADFAIGYGVSAIGVPNIPPNWGPTSWLVMGSGGMFSTVEDMLRYCEALAGEVLLHGELAERGRRSVGIGASERGFFFLRAINAGGDTVVLMSNSGGRRQVMESLRRGLVDLVMGDR